MGKKNRFRDNLPPEDSRKALGSNLNFAAAEAYKLLRTNLEFSLPVESGCRVIGVTSALKGEGKSVTAVNIAYTMAQTGGKVLLIEADLRLPTLARRVGVKPKPGLSNLLVGLCSGNDALQKTDLISNLWVITAGDVPPNPSELLGSANMATTISVMKSVFNVIVVDLPPVSTVTDAALMSKLLDGMIVVVRQGYCDRGALDETVRQLRFVDAKILGFVMTGADTRKKAYKRYGKSYGDYKSHTSSGSGT